MLWPELDTTKLWILVYEFGRILLSMLDRYDIRLQDSRIGEIQRMKRLKVSTLEDLGRNGPSIIPEQTVCSRYRANPASKSP